MKKLLLLLVCAFVGISTKAERISSQQALQKAQQFMQDKQFKHSGMRRAPRQNVSSPAYYVFNAEDNNGFVIVAGDNRMKAILGYAENGNLDQDNLPDNLKWLLDYYAQIANDLPADKNSSTLATTDSRAELKPLVTTCWDQGAPYNVQCPTMNGQQTPTGCVATAMAQVINYFQWPINDIRSMADYTTNTRQLRVPALPARKIGWYNMSDDEIAWLMRYCGQAVQMDYMPTESAARAIDIANALISVFNYSRTTSLVIRESYSDEKWEELIYNELSVGRPVIYNADEGEGKNGHSFIVHGYKNGLFCVNWGWSGQCDGYFALTNLSPNENRHFTENQSAVIAIQPASNNDDEQMAAAKERTIRMDEAGTLSKYIADHEKYDIKKLTIAGNLNGTDLALIREMAEGKGQLSALDLRDARIVKGGNPYYEHYTTKDNTLGEMLFFRSDKLQSVVVPSSVTTIANSAFIGSGLVTFTLPKTVTSMGNGVFSGCKYLVVLDVEEGNPNYYSPAGSNVIVERAKPRIVAGCPNSIIPEGITTIASEAFSVYMMGINLPESLTTIEDYAFYGASLKHIRLPKNVTKIGANAFTATETQGIEVADGNTVYDSRNNCNCLIETATNTLVLGSTGSQIPEDVKTIGEGAFRYSFTESITLPKSVNKIDNFAFANMYLRYLEIPTSVTTFGMYAFSSLSYLKVCKVKWQTPPTITNDVFSDVNQKACLIVPNGTKAKYQSASGWKSFKTILEESEYPSARTVNVATAGTLSTLIPESERNSVEELVLTGQLNNEDMRFIREQLCTDGSGNLHLLDMTNASLEGDVLSPEALRFSTTLQEVKLPNTLKEMGRYAFWESGIRKIVIPKSVTKFGEDLFYQCKNLTSISVEAGNALYDSRENCNAIIETATNTLLIGCRSTVVPSSVVAIGATALSGVRGLTSVDLPEGVTSIGSAAFWADEGLTSVTLSKTITSLGNSPFGGCSNIKTFIVDPENPVYDSRNNSNCIIKTATNTLIQGFGSTKIPEGVEKIATQAFQYQTMTSIEIPASVKEIDASAFLFCNNMTTVISHIKKPFPVSATVFSGDNMETAVLYVPFGTKNAYATTSGWGAFPKIVEMEPTGEELNQHAVSMAEADFGKQYAGLDNQVEIPVTVVGGSIDPITSIDYTITSENGSVFEGHLEVDPITYMMTTEVLIPFKADAAVGEKVKKLTITKVNGQTNETAENTISGTLVTVKRKPKYVPLVEEATGTWCGWCPRGSVGLKMLNRLFRNDVVTIAVHTDDPMQVPGYTTNATSFPSCQINHGAFCDPYYGSSDQAFGIRRDVEAAMRQYTIGEIAVNAEWTDESQTAIKVSTTTTFVEDVDQSPYQIGYILLEDKVKGVTTDWYQSNYFANTLNKDPNLKALVDSPSKIQDVSYDYVPVAIWEPRSGVEGTLPATITSEVPMSYTYTLDIADNTRIQNKKKLTVVALLLNKETGEVLNAAKYKFTPDPDPSVVTMANYTRTYGDANPSFEFTVTGGALEGEPEINCEATATSPVGEYPIVIKQGTVINEEVTYVGGMLTIKPAPLTVTAVDAEREQGQENPIFTLSYTGWKLNDNESVLTKKPVATTKATKDSPVGVYDIVVSGGEAQNYDLNYVTGKLTVMVPSSIASLTKSDATYDVYTLTGLPVRLHAKTLKGLMKGIYLVNGRKLAIK